MVRLEVGLAERTEKVKEYMRKEVEERWKMEDERWRMKDLSPPLRGDLGGEIARSSLIDTKALKLSFEPPL